MELEWIGYGREMPRVPWVLSPVMDTFQLIPHSTPHFLLSEDSVLLTTTLDSKWVFAWERVIRWSHGHGFLEFQWRFKRFVTEGDSGDAQPRQLGFQGTCSTLNGIARTWKPHIKQAICAVTQWASSNTASDFGSALLWNPDDFSSGVANLDTGDQSQKSSIDPLWFYVPKLSVLILNVKFNVMILLVLSLSDHVQLFFYVCVLSSFEGPYSMSVYCWKVRRSLYM